MNLQRKTKRKPMTDVIQTINPPTVARIQRIQQHRRRRAAPPLSCQACGVTHTTTWSRDMGAHPHRLPVTTAHRAALEPTRKRSVKERFDWGGLKKLEGRDAQLGIVGIPNHIQTVPYTDTMFRALRRWGQYTRWEEGEERTTCSPSEKMLDRRASAVFSSFVCLMIKIFRANSTQR